MLRRVRMENHRGRFRIPRRGRIRALVLCAALGGAALMLFRRQSGEASHQQSLFLKQAAAARPHTTSKKQMRNALANTRSGGTLTAEDVTALLQKFPPRLSAVADTVLAGNRRLAVHFSLDTALQEQARNHLLRYHPKYGAVVALHPSSGRVLALTTYNNPEEPPLGDDVYCRSIFPAASIIKIITAAAAIDKAGLTASSEIQTTGNNHTLYRFQLEPVLKNYRTVTLEEAFAYSMNPVFARIGIYAVGAEAMRGYMTKFGFHEPVPFELPADSCRVVYEDSAFALAELASGFNQQTLISPLFGALLAAAISHNGLMPAPTLVDSITDITTGARLYTAAARPWRVPIRPAVAAQLRTMMRSVARYGTARKAFVYVKRSGMFEHLEYGGKTGNVGLDGMGRVDWFVGFARHPSDPAQHIAVSVVTVHGPYWTVHSSFIAAEMMRAYIRNLQIARTKPSAGDSTLASGTPRTQDAGL